MSLHKYDPIINQHVMFYESKLPVGTRKLRLKRYQMVARWTGKGMDDLVNKVDTFYKKKGYF